MHTVGTVRVAVALLVVGLASRAVFRFGGAYRQSSVRVTIPFAEPPSSTRVSQAGARAKCTREAARHFSRATAVGALLIGPLGGGPIRPDPTRRARLLRMGSC